MPNTATAHAGVPAVQADRPPMPPVGNGGLPGPLTVNNGTFDIKVDKIPGASDSNGKGSNDKGPNADPPSGSAAILPGAAPGGTIVEQLLVPDHSAPPADQASVDHGTIVLAKAGPKQPVPPPPPPPDANSPPGNPGNGNGNGNAKGAGWRKQRPGYWR
jgi:hypothetical protein